MSESREHKNRYNQKLQLIAEFERWRNEKPRAWRVFSFLAWVGRMPARKF